MVAIFNFEIDEILSVEKIVRAAFLNPNRKKFERYMIFYELRDDIHSAESLLVIIRSYMQVALAQFDSKAIRLYDTSNLFPSVNKIEWLKVLKHLRWYGPYRIFPNGYLFSTAGENGDFQGLKISFCFEREFDIRLEYVAE